MSKSQYTFYKIPKVVFCNPNLSPCAKLVFAYLLSRESFFVNAKGYTKGCYFQCYLRTIANQIGRSTDSVRKNYLPELIGAAYIEKKNSGGKKGDSHSTTSKFRIRWDNLLQTKPDDNGEV